MKILLLAGGQGTRLWPVSTKEKPKQFHKLGTKKTLLQETYDRVKCFGEENIFIVSLEEQKALIKEQIPDILDSHIFSAPCSQDSAMGVAFSLLCLQEIEAHATETLIFLPADHFIEPAEEFCKFLKEVENIHQKNKNKLITIGINPDTPSTRFGYIELSEEREENSYKVKQFIEKPEKEKAEKLLEQGNVVWNAGFIVGSLERMLQAFEQYAPEFIYSGKNVKAFESVPRISFDYAIWEKEKDILCIPSQKRFSWNDIGTWDAIPHLNTQQKVISDEDSQGNIAFSESGKDVVLLGIEDCLIIEGENGILVAKKNHIDTLKNTLKKL